MTGVVVALAALCIVAVIAAQSWAVTRLRDRRPPVTAASGATTRAAHAAGPQRVGSEDDGALVRVLRRSPWLARSLGFVSVALAIVAVGMIGYPFYTNLYADRVQQRLDRQFASDELRADYVNCREVGLGDPSCRIEDGDSLTRIQIPDIQIDVVVVEGVGAGALRAGAGHYPSTPLPCEAGNVAIAGHRTTYGRPFHDLDLLEVGDEIRLQIPIGQCTYRVVATDIVSPNDVGVIASTADNRLTLTTCHPKGSARQRLVITAQLVDPVLA